MNIPEGVQTITAEGRDLKTAITGAAEQLGLHPAQIDYKLDMSHFRSHTGVSVARNTVRIIAWGSGRPAPSAREARPKVTERPAAEAREEAPTDGNGDGRAREERPPRSERPERPERRERSEARGEGGDRESGRRRRRRRGRGNGEGEAGEFETKPEARGARPDKPESLRGAEAGTTEASAFAQQWFTKLMEHMGVAGEVTGTGSDTRVHLAVKAERAGRIVGKRGATLGSIRHLLGLALEKQFGALTIDVDVGDDRPREEREKVTRERDAEPRGERRRGREGGGGERGRYPEEKLRALARRAAEKALETGQTITINLELNSFDRRIVHLEVAEVDGVESQSEERMGPDGRMVKYVQIIPIKG